MYNNKRRIIKIIIAVALLILSPILFSLPFSISYNRPDIVEIILVAFGLIELLIVMIMYQIKSRRLYKDGMSNSDYIKTDKYKTYRTAKIVLLSTAGINIFLSILVFVIFVK